MAEHGAEKNPLDVDLEIDALEPALASDNYRVRGATVEKLGRYRTDRAIALLLHALKDPRKQVRARAVQALGRVGSRDTFDPLAAALQDRTATVRKQAVEAIGRLGGADNGLPLLLPMLRDRDPIVKYRTISVIGAFRDTRIVEPLLEAAHTSDSQQLYHVMLALAPLNDLRTVVLLCSSLKIGQIGLAALSARLLRTLGDAQTLPRSLVSSHHLPARYRVEALEAIRGVRYGGWLGLGALRYPLPPILEFCDQLATADPDPNVRFGARDLLDHENLLRGSAANHQGGVLLRAAESGPVAVPSDELLRGSDRGDDEPLSEPTPFWRRLFQKIFAQG